MAAKPMAQSTRRTPGEQRSWKEFLSARSRVGMAVHFVWTPGKKSPALKQIDRAAKNAALRGGPEKDRGYSRGSISRSMVNETAIPFPAKGQIAVIRPYQKERVCPSNGREQSPF